MKVTLIRHGEGFHNVVDSEFDNSNPNWNILYPKLTNEGIKQCLKAQTYFKDKKYDLFLVSPLRRTIQTFENIFGFNHTNIKSLDLIRENVSNICDYRESIDVIKKDYSLIDYTLIEENQDIYFRDNIKKETQEKINDRCDKLYCYLKEISSDNSLNNIMIVTHGAFIKSFLTLHGSKIGISDNSWFKNCEHRTGFINTNI